MNSIVAAGLAALLAFGLQACCSRSCDAGEAEAAATLRTIPDGTLEIVDWGPRRTRAGVPFNVQAGGHAAIWIRLNHSLDGRTALVRFKDAYLEGQVSAGALVTAVVPEAAYAEPGNVEVSVVARTRNARWHSNTVVFTVE